MITENKNKDISIKELFEKQLVEATIKSTIKKKKSSKKILKTLTAYDLLNNAFES